MLIYPQMSLNEDSIIVEDFNGGVCGVLTLFILNNLVFSVARQFVVLIGVDGLECECINPSPGWTFLSLCSNIGCKFR